jgi:hypothetical protein
VHENIGFLYIDASGIIAGERSKLMTTKKPSKTLAKSGTKQLDGPPLMHNIFKPKDVKNALKEKPKKK